MNNKSNNPSLAISITPGTVYVSTNPDQASYANLVITIENTGPGTLSVNGIAITLPVTLAPVVSLNSISPIAAQPNLWSLDSSLVTPGEFDATPVSGDTVEMDVNENWQFTLKNVTLVNTITTPVADVSIVVTFADGTCLPQLVKVNIDLAIASIVSFNSQPADIDPGGLAVLTWQCDQMDYCIITAVSKNPLPASGSHNVTPGSTTVYTLYAYGAGVILSAQWAISVANPQIISFGVSGPVKINLGDSVKLIWNCNQFTESVEIDANTGVTIPPLNTGGNTPTKGSISVGPVMAPTTFTLYAYGSNRENFNTSTAVISINDVTATLTATPSANLWVEDVVTLSWTITNALKVALTPELTNGPSLQNLSGSANYYPAADITALACELSVTGFVNDMETTITNNPPVALTFQPVSIAGFSISPAIINPTGNPNQATLAWNTVAQNVSIENIGNVNPIGSELLKSPDNGSVYVLSAGTNYKPAMITRQVQVVNAYGPYTFTNFYIVGGPYSQYFIFPIGNLQPLSQYMKAECLVTITGVLIGGKPVTQPINVRINKAPGNVFGFSISDALEPQWINPSVRSGVITVLA